MIGVFDSGVGGLTLVQELLKELPENQIVYFGDTARVPYGTKGDEIIKRYAKQNVAFLLSQGAKIIVVACNTVSAVAMDSLYKAYPDVLFFEVISPAINAAYNKSKSKNIGVIGTTATIDSHLHKKLLTEKGKINVSEVACPLFVPLVEENFIERGETKRIARYYLKSLKDSSIDTLILSCTHYPFLEKVISRVMGEKVKLVNPAEATVKIIKDYLKENKDVAKSLTKGNNHKIFASDSKAKFFATAKKLLNLNFEVKEVDIENQMKCYKPNWVEGIMGLYAGACVYDGRPFTDEHGLKHFRQAMSKNLPFAENEIWIGEQIHGKNVTIINKKVEKSDSEVVKNSDGLVSTTKNILLTVHTADCVPIIFYDKDKEVIATAHAGWQGTLQKIPEEIINKMESNTENLQVWIGPAIHKCCYEIDKSEERYKNFKKEFGEEVLREENGKMYLDLIAANKKVLTSVGVNDKNIEISELCTSCSGEELPSFRRQGKRWRENIIAFIGMQ
ncbi:MAG: glutamate racemase [bacterium]